MNEVAPGELEDVRRFLNTWEEGIDGRPTRDRLPELAAAEDDWGTTFDDLPYPRSPLAELAAARTALRDSLGSAHPTQLNALLASHPLRPAIQAELIGFPVRFEPETPGTIGQLLGRVTTAIAERQWHRLKACPECLFVFYDVSRNASRTWCAMTPAQPGDRGCGAIAKSRAHRQRQRAR
jgi:hypothetical protein